MSAEDSAGRPKIIKRADRIQPEGEGKDANQIRDEKLRVLLMRVRADMFSIIYAIEEFLDFPEDKHTSKRLKSKR